MSHHPALIRLAQTLRQARANLRGGHVVALSAVAVMAVGLVGLRTVELPGPRPVTDGDRLRIEVVHPVEPDIVPGTVMDVGELVDGFQGLPPPPPSLTDVLWSYDEAWLDELPPLPAPWRRAAAEVAVVHPPEPEPPTTRRGETRWFGFDAPRRNYGAERAARRARLEAVELRAREEERARWSDRADGDGERWRAVPGPREVRLPDPRAAEEAEEARAEDLADRESFTGLQ